MECNQYRCQSCALNKLTTKPFATSERKIESALMNYISNLQFEQVPKINNENNELEILKTKKKVEKQREKYQKAWSNDLMTDDEFTERMNETKILLNSAKEKLQTLEVNNHQEIDVAVIKEKVNNIKKNWSHLSPDEKKQFMSMFIESIKIDKKME